MGASSSSAVGYTGSTDGHIITSSNADSGSKETGLDGGVSTDTILYFNYNACILIIL